ncbi:di-heme oxidoreductase family protein [Flavobacterium poyangense]|uniref:di-heme oxidoreductase family protein n=1 Tax=Flavobacterium poyangense TaxID=2204302 RepID=UPI001423CFA7|nr:di-heme oxidoredictase family protein [Flavobacterium sp. JXAS1]
MKNLRVYWFVIVCVILHSCSDNNNDDEESYIPLTAEEGEQLSGGVGTVFNTSEEAFGFFMPTLTFDQQTDFGVGNSFFRQSWVTAPSSTTARDGLGPFFNAHSCSSCHFKDGRGRPPLFDGEDRAGLLFRLSVVGQDANGLGFPDPVYGSQLQDHAILGQTVEGQFTISYQPIKETFDDGTVVTLQKPLYTITNLGYGPLAAVQISPRIANQIIGLGLLEAISESTVIGFADENDSNGDGISGKPNYVHDVVSNSTKLGRFGWKANQPNVKQQVAAALSGDMGITSGLFPNESGPKGVDLTTIPNGGTPEITDSNLDRMAFYSSTLAVPARRNYTDQNVLKGKKTFETIGCTSCHIPKIQTGTTHPITILRNQTIRPYTDLLLHDMGAGLADNATDFKASGSEWRTPPLWGIGLIKIVNGHTNLLHDGRAKNVEEAILWHGGEGQKAKEKYKKLSATERENLLSFINSL